MLGGKKHQFYVQFLGWVETSGLRGTEYTEPVVSDLRRRQRKWKYAPKLTLQVGKKEMKITQDVEDEKKKGKKIKTIKFPIIPSRDITYAVQALSPVDGRPDDIVACIYLGFVPRTRKYVHVHVYRFDSPETATTFSRYLNQIIASNTERTNQIERELITQGQIEDPRARKANKFNSSDGMSDKFVTDDSVGDSGSYSDDAFPSGSDEIEADLQSLKESVPYDSVTDELKNRLRLSERNEAPPLLLPPKDYDTIVRRHGNLDKTEKRKCLQIPIVGDAKARNISAESGIEIPSPTSSDGKPPAMDISDERFSSSNSSHSNGSPHLSARDYVYPPQSPRTPLSARSSNSMEPKRHPAMRQMSNSSAHSANSSVFSGEPSVIVYKGNHITEIPPADYDSEEPIMRVNRGHQSARNLTHSMPASMIQKEMDYGYSVLPKRLNRNSDGMTPRSNNVSPRPNMDYLPRSAGVRRVNSMYR